MNDNVVIFNYDSQMSSIIEKLNHIYQHAPKHILNKYDYIFTAIFSPTERPPIVKDSFTYYPSCGEIILSDKLGTIKLPDKKAEIFYFILLSSTKHKHCSKIALLNTIYSNESLEKKYHHLKTMEVHINGINKMIKPTGIHIKSRRGFGWYIKDLPSQGAE